MTKDKDDDMKNTHRTSAVGKGMAKSLGFGKKDEPKKKYGGNYGGHYGGGYGDHSYGGGYGRQTPPTYSRPNPRPNQSNFDWDNQDGGWDYPSRNSPTSRGGSSGYPQGASSETHGRSTVEYIELDVPHKTGTMQYDYAAVFQPNEFEREMSAIKDRVLDVLELRGYILPGLIGVQLGVAIADIIEEHALMKNPVALVADIGQGYSKVAVKGRVKTMPTEEELDEEQGTEGERDQGGEVISTIMFTALDDVGAPSGDWAQLLLREDGGWVCLSFVSGKMLNDEFSDEASAREWVAEAFGEGRNVRETVQ